MATSKTEQRLRAAMEKTLGRRSNIPGLEDLAGKLVKSFGGIDKFVDSYKECFDASSPMVKTRLMEGMLKLILLHENSRPPQDMSAVGDEELAKLGVMLAQRMARDGEEAEGEAPAGGDGAAGA